MSSWTVKKTFTSYSYFYLKYSQVVQDKSSHNFNSDLFYKPNQKTSFKMELFLL